MILYTIAANISSEIGSSDNVISFFPTTTLEVFEDFNNAHQSALKASSSAYIFQLSLDEKMLTKSPFKSRSFFIAPEFIQDVLKAKYYSFERISTFKKLGEQLLFLIENLSKQEDDKQILALAEELNLTIHSNDVIALYDFYEKIVSTQLLQYKTQTSFNQLKSICEGLINWTKDETSFLDISKNELYYQKMKLLSELRKIRLFMSKYVPVQMIDLDTKLPKIISLVSKLESKACKNKNTYHLFLKDLTKFCHMIVKAFGLNAQGLPISKNRLSIANYRSEINSLMSKTDFLNELEMLGFILLSLGVCIPTFSLLHSGGKRASLPPFNHSSIFSSINSESSERTYYKYI